MTDNRLPRVWRVFTGTPASSDAVVNKANERGWDVKPIRCVALTSKAGRRSHVLRRQDAAHLYEDMHRRPVAVIYDGKPRVRTNPRPPLRDRWAVSLFQFCRYKSFAISLASGDAKNWERDFEIWITQAGCDGRSDPRFLPFHIFASKEKLDLDQEAGRKKFRELHGRRKALEDKRERRWAVVPAGGGHGRRPQIVRGLNLDIGFHWDVTAQRSPVIASVNTIWRIPRDGYLRALADRD